MIEKPTVAIFVSGGVVASVRSNISRDLEIKIIEVDDDPNDECYEVWERLKSELPFGNY